MRVIIPKEMTLISSSIPEDSSPVWDSGTAYNKDDIVKVQDLNPNHITRKFRSLVDSNQGNYPPDNPDKWEDLGATDRYKLLDERLGTQSVASNLTFTIRAKKIDALGLLQVEGVSVTITVTRTSDSSIVFGPKEFSLRQTFTDGLYSYFFDEYYYRYTLLVDIPIEFGEVDIKVEFEGTEAKCGLVYAGLSFGIGEALWDARVGIRDFSVKEVDEFGFAYLVKRDYSKELEFDVMLPTNKVSVVQQKLAEIRATPCIWDANNEDTEHEALIVYGFYESFEEVLKSATVSYCSLKIEGLI